jgi:hypothetical protein
MKLFFLLAVIAFACLPMDAARGNGTGNFQRTADKLNADGEIPEGDQTPAEDDAAGQGADAEPVDVALQAEPEPTATDPDGTEAEAAEAAEEVTPDEAEEAEESQDAEENAWDESEDDAA